MGSSIPGLYPSLGALGRTFDIRRSLPELGEVVDLVGLLGHLGVVQWRDPI